MTKIMDFFKREKSDKSKCAGYFIAEFTLLSLMSVLMLLISMSETVSLKMIFEGICVLFLGIAVFIAIIAYKKMQKGKMDFKVSVVSFSLLLGLLTFILVETCTQGLIAKAPILFFMGYFLSVIPFIIGALLLKKPKIWFVVWEIIYAVYGLTQYFVQMFRGAPARFSDLKNLKDAALALEDYKLSFSPNIILVLFQLAGVFYLIKKVEIVKTSKKIKAILAGGSCAAILLFVSITEYSYQWALKNFVISINFTTAQDKGSSITAGSMLMFYYDAVFNKLKIPENYNSQNGAEILSKYNKEISPDAVDEKPILIVVLNESCADFTRLKDFDINDDCLSTWRGLKENTIKGYVTVSPFGGNTCNSEYEFLTGGSMYFLPIGSAVYTNYLKTRQDSIVSHLKQLGYETIACVPDSGDVWGVNRIYPECFEFDEYYFEEDFNITEKINNRCTDEILFNALIDDIDKRDKSKGLFIFAKTVQNHAPYTSKVDGGIDLGKYSDEAADCYMNSLNISDESMGRFLEKLKNYDERIIVVSFGDHFPHLNEFTTKLLDGKNVSSLNTEEAAIIQQTPFFIWSNKSLEESYTENISLNYLAMDMLDTAGLPAPGYMKELELVREKIPIISGFGLKDNTGKWYSKNEDTPYKDLLNDYHTMQYYRMFDQYS